MRAYICRNVIRECTCPTVALNIAFGITSDTSRPGKPAKPNVHAYLCVLIHMALVRHSSVLSCVVLLPQLVVVVKKNGHAQLRYDLKSAVCENRPPGA